MGKFKVGDAVMCMNSAEPHVLYGLKYTISDVDGQYVKLKGTSGLWGYDRFELIPPTASASPAIRTVTRREIVPGVCGRVAVNGQIGWCASISLADAAVFNAAELREAAHLFNQLAEVLEEDAALEMKEAG